MYHNDVMNIRLCISIIDMIKKINVQNKCLQDLMLNCLHLNKNIGSVEKYVCQIMKNCIVVKISNSKF